MNKPADKQREFWEHVVNAVQELYIRSLTMQALLQASGAFSEADFDRRRLELKASLSSVTEKMVADRKAKGAARLDELLLKILADFEGPKQ